MNNGRTYLQKALSRFCDIPRCGTSELGSSPVKTARWPLGYVPGGHFLFANTPLRHSYHSRSVIARSGSGSRQTTCDPVSSTATLGEVAPVETDLFDWSVGKGVTATKRLNLPAASRHSRSDVKSYTVMKRGSRKAKSKAEGKPRSAQSLPVMKLLDYSKRLCVRCRVNEVYQDIKTMDWCEQCLWKFLQEKVAK